MDKDDYGFSVIMSVYKNDIPEQLQIAISSILNQTLPPNEIVIVADGPIPQPLINILENTKKRFKQTKVLYQEKNRGLGGALKIAVENSSYNYLARMDSDDISFPNRFELQMNVFKQQQNISIVGGMISEFADDPNNIISKRILPCTDKEIKKFMRSRCGVNHVTVIMKKDELIKSGNYQADFIQEDYYLWARMILCGCTFHNIPEIVVNVRSGLDQFARRGGIKYYKDVLHFNYWMYNNNKQTLKLRK